MKKFILSSLIFLVLALIPFPSQSHPVEYSGGAAVALGWVSLFGGDSHAANPTKTTTEFAYLNSLPFNKTLIHQAASGAMNTAEILQQ